MPSSRFLIASNTLGSSAASVTFSSIPNTFTDLVLKFSARTDFTSYGYNSMRVRINTDTGTNYSVTRLFGDGSNAYSSRLSNSSPLASGYNLDAATYTANTFGNAEIYFPNYTSSSNKPFAHFGVTENNGTEAHLSVNALLWRNSAAINQLVLSVNDDPTANFVSGSTFWLYGLKNS